MFVCWCFPFGLEIIVAAASNCQYRDEFIHERLLYAGWRCLIVLEESKTSGKFLEGKKKSVLSHFCSIYLKVRPFFPGFVCIVLQNIKHAEKDRADGNTKMKSGSELPRRNIFFFFLINNSVTEFCYDNNVMRNRSQTFVLPGGT